MRFLALLFQTVRCIRRRRKAERAMRELLPLIIREELLIKETMNRLTEVYVQQPEVGSCDTE